MPPEGAYQPLVPGRRPGESPSVAPRYRVLVHRKFKRHWDELVDRIGLQQAQEFWDHLALDPGSPPPTASTCVLKGKAGNPQGSGWSRTIHYELSSKARGNYQFHDEFQTSPAGDKHRVVAVLTLDFSSH